MFEGSEYWRGHLREGEEDGECRADDWRHPYDLLLRENGLVTRRLLAHTPLTRCPSAKAINLDSSSKYPATEMGEMCKSDNRVSDFE